MILGNVYDDPEVSGRVESLPQDVTVSAGDFTQSVPSALPGILSQVAARAVELGLQDEAWRATLAPCAAVSPASTDCVEEVVKQFGSRVWRRDVSLEEVESYLQFYDSVGGGEQGLTLLLRRILQSPALVFHIEAGAGEVQDRRLRLSSFEVASRLSYAITDGMPDSELIQAAREGHLNSTDEVRKHVERLLDTSLGRAKLNDFARYYAHLEQRSDPPAAVAELSGITDVTGLGQAMQREASDFFQHVVLEQNGTFSDLMLSPRAFPATEALAQIFQTSVMQNGEPVEAPDYPGLLHRPALLTSSGNRTSPIVRGAHIRKLFLCTDLTLPANLDGVAEAQQALQDSAELPNRQAVEQATAGAACRSCHTLVNPLGFAFEGFDQVGARRSKESVLDGSGQVVATFPIDTRVEQPQVGADGPTTVSDSVELVKAIAASAEARHCLGQRAFEYYRRSRVDAILDGCAIRELNALDAQTSVRAMLTSAVANEDLFWRSVTP